MNLKNRRALITGGSRGIGEAISLAFAKEGCDVAFSYYRSAENALKIKQVIESCGRRAFAVKTDVSSPDSVIRLCEDAISFLGGLDILVNCAGTMQQCPVEELSLDEWNRVLATNLTSAFLTAQSCLDALKQSPRGRIINISSQAAFTGSKNRTAYSAAKSGLQGLTYSLAKELGPSGITVNTISPGRIVTDMIRGDMKERAPEWIEATPLKRFGETDEIASAAVFLAGDSGSYITGANINVNGGILMG